MYRQGDFIFIEMNDVPSDGIAEKRDNVQTAKQAIAWRFGMAEEEYMPLLQA